MAKKSAKYPSLPSSHIFQSLAQETLGPVNTTGISFLSKLSRRLTSVSGDSRETMYLFQRVSLSVQRYNPVAFKGTFQSPPNWTSATSANLVFDFNPMDLQYTGSIIKNKIIIIIIIIIIKPSLGYRICVAPYPISEAPRHQSSTAGSKYRINGVGYSRGAN